MSQPKKYKTEVVSFHNPVENVYSVEFRSLSGRFRYLPGQFLHLALDEYDPSFGWPESRCFSMQSSPSAEFIKISFSVKGKFTARMVSELKIGKVVDLKLPYGELFQKDFSKSNVVFIAGGTGITPFLSLFSHDSFNEYIDPKIYLGFKSESYNIYADALSKLNSNNLKIMYESVDGILNIDSIFNENSIKSHYFISGPPQMIKGFKRELVLKGVPQDQILTDEWD